MSAQGSYRLGAGGAIDRAASVAFKFDGKALTGCKGDTLASALLANNVRLIGRSFKYHRPRGVMALGSMEPNGLVEVREGARREPNIPATTVELFDGLVAQSQNRFPSLRYDLMAVNQLASPFLSAGFYYKTFMWPASFWESVYEKAIRKAAGLGRAAGDPDPDGYDHVHMHTDVLVVGAGPTGLSAADAALSAGARVLVVDENAHVGGALAYEREDIDGAPASAFVDAATQRIDSHDNGDVLTRTTALGVYDHNLVVALERVSDHELTPGAGKPRQRLRLIRAKQIVLAAGALERPLTFANNDKPGVMLSSAVRGYVNRYAVAPGRRIAIVTTNDDGYRTARDLIDQNVEVSLIADARDHASAVSSEIEGRGVPVLRNTLPQKVLGGVETEGLALQTKDGAPVADHRCDTVAVAGGFNPCVHLTSHLGAAPYWREDLLAFVPDIDDKSLQTAGACRGVYDTRACLDDGAAAGVEAARRVGCDVVSRSKSSTVALDAANVFEGPGDGKKSFVDFQNDVTAADVRLSAQEGYEAVEHLKRYTTLGMATDQGKTSNINGLAVLAAARNVPIDVVGTTRFRPPYTPAAIGAYAGHHRGKEFQPIRRTAFHRCHEEESAVFVEAGQWLRPRFYPQGNEDVFAALKREAAAVRTSVGVCDVSTLGKIEIFGPDAAALLNKVYINAWSKLAVGKARYGVMLRDDGYMFDDGTTSRLAEDHFFLTCTTANAARVLAHLEHTSQVLYPDYDVNFVSATEQWCGLALAGPKSRALLADIVDGFDVSNENLPFMGIAETTIGGAPARIFRISFSGELAYEINVPWGWADHLWRKLRAAGEAYDLTPYGSEALAVLRIEKGHIAGPEIDGRTMASDAGLGGMMSKKKDFIGKRMALHRAETSGERPSLVGVKPVNTSERLRGGAHLVASREDGLKDSLGWVSSVTDSPNVGSWIGLGFLKGGMEQNGRTIYASYPLKDEFVEVELCNPCFVDPEGERLRG
ncbi:MAG: sarcosine oxidase subunit alpha family protein [Pseudomonadota bacterium]